MLDWLHEFFHAPVDGRPLAVVRVLIGAIVVASAVSYGRSAALLLGPDGVLPHGVWQAAPDRRFASVLRWLPARLGVVHGVIALHGTAGAMLAIGCATPIAAAVVFATTVSLHHRNRFVMHSGDALLRKLTFLLVFADSGALWSVDALSGAIEPTGAPWAFRLMQLQLAAVYLQAAWFKRNGRTWREGTASHYASRLLAHRRRPLPAVFDSAAMHRVVTWGTLAIELFGGTLIWWQPARPFVLAGLLLLHVSLMWLMRMHVFQWTMLAALVLFVPGRWFDALG